MGRCGNWGGVRGRVWWLGTCVEIGEAIGDLCGDWQLGWWLGECLEAWVMIGEVIGDVWGDWGSVQRLVWWLGSVWTLVWWLEEWLDTCVVIEGVFGYLCASLSFVSPKCNWPFNIANKERVWHGKAILALSFYPQRGSRKAKLRVRIKHQRINTGVLESRKKTYLYKPRAIDI